MGPRAQGAASAPARSALALALARVKGAEPGGGGGGGGGPGGPGGRAADDDDHFEHAAGRRRARRRRRASEGVSSSSARAAPPAVYLDRTLQLQLRAGGCAVQVDAHFRACCHCGGVFPGEPPDLAPEGARRAFCSGECFLTHAVLAYAPQFAPF